MSGTQWSTGKIEAHKSSQNGMDLLWIEFTDMMEKQQWIVLPATMIMKMFGLQRSPIGLVPQKNCQDRMISDYSYINVNDDTFNILLPKAM